jgi:hypothetical protein
MACRNGKGINRACTPGRKVGNSSRSKKDAAGSMPPCEDLERRVRELVKESRHLKRRNAALEKKKG